jgi:hypothetical protein
MPNGTTGTGSPTPLPGWLGPVVTLTTQVGVPTVVAGVLLWFVLFRIDGTLQYIQEQEDLRTKLVAQMQAELVETMEHQTAAFQQAIDKNIAVNKEHAEDLHRLLSQIGKIGP